jgi:hypothetical protein
MNKKQRIIFFFINEISKKRRIKFIEMIFFDELFLIIKKFVYNYLSYKIDLHYFTKIHFKIIGNDFYYYFLKLMI